MNELINLFENFHFIRPWWLISIAPALVILVFLWNTKNINSTWSGIISNDLMPYLLVQQQGQITRTPFYLLGLGWVLVSIAMAGPAWKEIPQPVEKKIQARVIILDLSISMQSKDIAPSRYARAKHKLSDLLKTYKEGETGLIAYSGGAHVVTPLTDDTNTIINLVPSLRPEIMPIKGSNTLAAIESAVVLLQNTGHQSGNIILITDGVQNQQIDSILNIDRLNLYNLSILGVGTEAGLPILKEDGSFLKDRNNAIIIPKLESGTLSNLARKLGGRYVKISTDDTDIDALNRTVLSNNLGTKTKKTSQQFDTWQDVGPWLVLFCLPIISLSFRKGWLGVLVLTSFLYGATKPEYSQASAWDDLWTRKDQQGQQAFDQKDFSKAADLFNNKNWKASSLYRQGDFEAAAEAFANPEKNINEDSLYNQGNALANASQLKEALSLYEKVLDINPDHKDAKFNYDLVSELLKEQQSSQKNNNKDNQSSKEKDQQKNQSDSQKQQNQNNQDQENSDQQNQKDSKQQNQEKQQTDQKSQTKTEKDKNTKNSQKDNQQQQNQQAKQQQDQNENESDNEKSKWQNESTDVERSEQQQALEQWLKRIPDDPGDLLKRKFYLQSLQNDQQDNEISW